MTIFHPRSVVPVYDNRDFEALLIAELIPWTHGAAPVRLVVPSESLRLHWLRRLAESKGALLGVEVTTHSQLIRTMLTKAGVVWKDKSIWVEHRVRELASKRPTLRRALGDLDDGYALVASAVNELFGAGFHYAQKDAIVDAIQGWPKHPTLKVAANVSPRIVEIIQVASDLQEELEGEAPCTLWQAVVEVVERLRKQGETLAPSRQLIFIGYCDATGCVADFLAAAQRHAGAVITVEFPVCPTRPEERDPGQSFAEPFHARFGGMMASPVGEVRSQKSIRWLSAPDPFAEVEAVAQHISDDISDGIPPEDIALVVRSIAGWQTPIRRALSGAGIPFSGVGATGLGAARQRRVEALIATLRAGVSASATQWLAAIGQEDNAKLALAFDEGGVRTVDELPDRFDEQALGLRAVGGLRVVDGAPRVTRQCLSPDTAQGLKGLSEAFLEAFKAWPTTATAKTHWGALRECLKNGLAVVADDDLWTTVEQLQDQVAEQAEFDRDEAIRMYTACLVGFPGEPIGGAGGGVAVLDVTEARGRCFERLYVMGLNRGQFPRVVSEDALLPDAVRRGLKDFLPDLREKRLGIAEERFLFAQLMASSDVVMLSCSDQDGSGKDAHPSSLLVELQLEAVIGEAAHTILRHRPAREVGVARGLSGAKVADALAGGGASQALMSMAANKKGSFAAYTGQIGPPVLAEDRRNHPMYVTTIEATARCPWKTFLTRDLGVQERADPMAALPSVTRHLLGRVVHKVVERVVMAAVGTESRHGISDAVDVVWPSDSTLSAWVTEAAEACLRNDGVGWQGFARAVVPKAMASIGVLRELDGGLEGVWAAEREFRVAGPNGVVIGLKADRLDVVDGLAVVTDLKLGKPPTDAKKEETRRRKVLEAVRAGTLLQGALYARSMPGAKGRYLYIESDIDMPVREFEFLPDDQEIQDMTDLIVEEVSDALSAGAVFPRVSEATKDKTPAACGYCPVREACIIGDSGMRQAFMALVGAKNTSAAQRARHALWWRGQPGESS